MITETQKKDLTSRINKLYSSISEKMTKLNDLEYELDNTTIFLNPGETNPSQGSHNQYLMNDYNNLQNLFNKVNRASSILIPHLSNPAAEYVTTLRNLEDFITMINLQLKSLHFK